MGPRSIDRVPFLAVVGADQISNFDGAPAFRDPYWYQCTVRPRYSPDGITRQPPHTVREVGAGPTRRQCTMIPCVPPPPHPSDLRSPMVRPCAPAPPFLLQVFEKYDLYALGRMQFSLLVGPGCTFPDFTAPDDTRVRGDRATTHCHADPSRGTVPREGFIAVAACGGSSVCGGTRCALPGLRISH